MLRRYLLSCIGVVSLTGCMPPPAQTVYVPLPQAIGCDTSFTVVNQSSVTLEQLYFSSSSLRGWGPDQLGQNVLRPGRSMSFRANNEGAYDFRAVLENGRTYEVRSVNVCVASTITVTNAGLRAN